MSVEVAVGVATLWITTVSAAVGVALYTRNIVADREAKDERRHRQNLLRFSWICVALVRMGYQNGNMPEFDD